MTDVPALALEHIAKRFGDVAALVDASVTVRQGSVHALLGENGAGKTTLMRVAFGMHAPDVGTLRIHGTPVRLNSPGDAIARGVAMVHQHFTLVPAMTVAENVALGDRGRFDPARMRSKLDELAKTTGLALDPDARVRDLSIASQQRLELLKALSRDPQVIIFDEPTALLAPGEASDLLRRIRELADGGRAIVLITHKLQEALGVADDITVLRRGSTVVSNPRAHFDQESLVEAMLGQHEIRSVRTRAAAEAQATVIQARNVSIAVARAMRIDRATFDVRKGEIVGVAAVEGSGHRELFRAVARRLPISNGSLELPQEIGFVPDDRQRDGLVLDMSVTENYALRNAGRRRGRLQWAAMADGAQRIIDEFDVRVPTASALMRSLSGGNQQKFIVGRELDGSPSALVVENPARGLDIRASAFVYDQLLQARADGVAVLLYSSDLDEVLDIADRMLVVFSGRVIEVPMSREAIGRAMLGAFE